MGISIGLVGLGEFGSHFVKLFKSHPLVDRIALCDMEPDRIKKFAEDDFIQDKFNPTDTYTSLDDICKSDVDALVIQTQPWLHAKQCIQAMQSGKHAYSAVPILYSPDPSEVFDSVGQVIDAVKTTGQHYMLGETSYYDNTMMFLRRKAAENAFGRFISAEAQYSHDYSGAWGCSLRKVRQYRTATKSGSDQPAKFREYASRGLKETPMCYPTHSVSGPVSIMKAKALKVSAIGMEPTGYDDYFDTFKFSNITAFYHMDNGATFQVREHREVTGHGYEVNVHGTCGSFYHNKWHWTNRKNNTDIEEVPYHRTEEYSNREKRDKLPDEVEEAFRLAQNNYFGFEEKEFVPVGHGGSHPYLVNEFVCAVAENRIPAINVWEAAHYMSMGMAAQISAQKDGELVEVTDFGNAPEK